MKRSVFSDLAIIFWIPTCGKWIRVARRIEQQQKKIGEEVTEKKRIFVGGRRKWSLSRFEPSKTLNIQLRITGDTYGKEEKNNIIWFFPEEEGRKNKFGPVRKSNKNFAGKTLKIKKDFRRKKTPGIFLGSAFGGIFLFLFWSEWEIAEIN